MEPITLVSASPANGHAIPADPRVVYTVDFDPGMRAEVRVTGYGFGVRLIDLDAEQALPSIALFSSREQAIEHANELAGLKSVSGTWMPVS